MGWHFLAKTFLEMKAHKSELVSLLLEGPGGWRDAWQLGSLHEEYKRLKKRQDEQQQQWKEAEGNLFPYVWLAL